MEEADDLVDERGAPRGTDGRGQAQRRRELQDLTRCLRLQHQVILRHEGCLAAEGRAIHWLAIDEEAAVELARERLAREHVEQRRLART